MYSKWDCQVINLMIVIMVKGVDLCVHIVCISEVYLFIHITRTYNKYALIKP